MTTLVKFHDELYTVVAINQGWFCSVVTYAVDELFFAVNFMYRLRSF